MKYTLALVALSIVLVAPAQAAERALETRVAWSPLCSGEMDPAALNRSVFLGALVGALAPKLIGGAIDAAATALKKAGERRDVASSAANATTRPYAVSKDADLGLAPEHGCLVVARGQFADSTGTTTPEPIGLDFLAKMTAPVFIFEAKLKQLAGEPYFQLIPYRLRVGQFEGRSFWDTSDTRDFTFALSFSSPGGEKPFASATFDFVGIRQLDTLEPGSWRLANKASVPLALPPVPDSGKRAQAVQEAFMAPHVLASAVLTAIAVGVPPKIETAPNPYESAAVKAAIDELCQKAVKDYNRDFPKSPVTDERCGYKMSAARANADRSVEALHTPEARQAWARRICPSPQKRSDNSVACGADLERPIGADARFGYMLTAASIVETKPGSKFAAFLGEALGAAKDDLTKAISQQIVPAQRKAADEAEGSASRAARRGLALADLGVTKAEQALAELQAETPAPAQSKVTAARAELMQAKIAANDAYRLAGLAAPFPELD